MKGSALSLEPWGRPTHGKAVGVRRKPLTSGVKNSLGGTSLTTTWSPFLTWIPEWVGLEIHGFLHRFLASIRGRSQNLAKIR